MTVRKYSNNAGSVLAVGIAAGDTFCTVAGGTGGLFPTLTAGDIFYATLTDAATNNLREIVRVTAISTDTMTIVRAQQLTTSRAYLAGDKFEQLVTADLGLNAAYIDQANTFTQPQYAPTPAAGTSTTQLATTAFVATNFAPMAAGTRLAFNQTAAPTGWTKDTAAALNDSTMRIVTGAVGSGGSYALSAGCTVVAAHTHTVTTGNGSADHTHGITDPGHAHNMPYRIYTQNQVGGNGQAGFAGGYNVVNVDATSSAIAGITINYNGSAHTHSGTTADSNNSGIWIPKYNDFIVAVKN